MTNNHFKGMNNPQEIKEQFRNLAMIYHPARQAYNLDPIPEEKAREIYKEIEQQYKEALQALDKQTYTAKTAPEGGGKDLTYYYKESAEEMIIGIIRDLLSIPMPGSSELWIIGTWLWITNTTKEDDHKDLRRKLKNHKFRWNRHRQCWQWSPPGSRSFRSKKSKEDIGALYGAARLDTEDGRKAVNQL